MTTDPVQVVTRLAMAACLCGVLPVAADDYTFEVTPFVAVVAGGEFESAEDGSEVDLDSSEAYGLTFDLGAPGFDRQYQLYYSQQPTALDDVGTPVDVDVEYLHVGGILAFPEERYVPYIVGTLGATRFSADADVDYDDETEFSFSLGGGVKIPLARHFALRLEGRGFLTLVDSESQLFCISVGGDASCLIRTSGSTFLQFQALAGVTLRF